MGKHDGRPWQGPQRHNQRETRRIGGTHRPNDGCCSYVEAARAIGHARFRLAARYIRMDVKARLGLI